MGKDSGRTKRSPKNRCNLKGALIFCPYIWPNGLKYFFSGSAHKQWKDYQGIIHNTYNGGNIETDQHVICLIPEDVENLFAFPNLTTPVIGTLGEVLYNGNTKRDKSYLNGFGTKKDESRGVPMMMTTYESVLILYCLQLRTPNTAERLK